ncbi:MAG: DUF4870 domain-containing protein [Cyanobacteriota bacterium]
MDNLAQRKLLSALCHGAIFFSSTIVSIGIPITILFMTKDRVVEENAKESLNFHINLYIYGVIFVALIAVIGIHLQVVWVIASFAFFVFVMPILALIKVLSTPNQAYRYPFIFHVVK